MSDIALFGQGQFDLDLFGPLPPFGTGGTTSIRAELYRATIDNVIVEDLSQYVVDGYVEWHGDRSGGTPMDCEFTLTKTNLVTPYVDYLMPFLRLSYDDGRADVYEQVGLFAVVPPSESHTATTEEAVVAGRDLTWVLATSMLSATENVPTGTNVITRVRDLIDDAGITRHDIRESSKTTGYKRSFHVSKSRLVAVNHLLHAIGYYQIFMERDGRLRSLPYRRMSSVKPAKVYTELDIVDVLEVDQPPPDKFANVVIAKADRPDKPTLTSIQRNDNASNPRSTVALNREITKKVTFNDIETQADLDETAREELRNASVYEQVVTLRVMPDPRQEINRTVDLVLGGSKAHVDGRYRLRGWRVGFSPDDALVDITIQRVARFVTDSTVSGEGLLPLD